MENYWGEFGIDLFAWRNGRLTESIGCVLSKADNDHHLKLGHVVSGKKVNFKWVHQSLGRMGPYTMVHHQMVARAHERTNECCWITRKCPNPTLLKSRLSILTAIRLFIGKQSLGFSVYFATFSRLCIILFCEHCVSCPLAVPISLDAAGVSLNSETIN